MKNKKKLIIGGVVTLLLIAGIAGSGTETSTNNVNSTNTTDSSENASEGPRFTDRADAQPEDLEIVAGESAMIDGVRLAVDKLEYKKSISEFETADNGKTYLLATFTITNESNDTQSYNPFDFRVQTAQGQVLDHTFVTLTDTLNSGDLIAGGTVTGTIPFEVPVETESQYIIWKPSAFDAARVIIQSTQN